MNFASRLCAKNIWHRGKQELRDAVELVLLPMLAAMLPWPLCYQLFLRIATFKFLYRAVSEKALMHAQSMGYVDNPEQWLRQRKLVTLVDHADLYLSLWRTNRWLKKNVTVEGVWPAADRAGVLMTFHWGAGMWALRHMASKGMQTHVLVASLDTPSFQGRTVLSWYARTRTHAMFNATRCPTIDASRHLKNLLIVLKNNKQAMVAIDVPADAASSTCDAVVLDKKIQVAWPLFKLVAEKNIPVTIYVTGFDWASGKRVLKIVQPITGQDSQEMAITVFSALSDVIKENPAAWHFWSEAERFFRVKEACAKS